MSDKENDGFTPYTNPIIQQSCKSMWLKGYSPEHIAKLPTIPVSSRAIRQWILNLGWKEEAEEIAAAANEKMKDDLIERAATSTRTHLVILDKLREKSKNCLDLTPDVDSLAISRIADANAKIAQTQRYLMDPGAGNEKADGYISSIHEMLVAVGKKQAQESELREDDTERPTV